MDWMLASLVLKFALTLIWIWFHDGAGWDAWFEFKQVTFGVATTSTLWWKETALLHTLILYGTLTMGPTGLTQAFPLICDIKTAYCCWRLNGSYRLGIGHITIGFANTEVTHLHNALLLLCLWFLGHVDRVVFGCEVSIVGWFWRLFYICYANHRQILTNLVEAEMGCLGVGSYSVSCGGGSDWAINTIYICTLIVAHSAALEVRCPDVLFGNEFLWAHLFNIFHNC